MTEQPAIEGRVVSTPSGAVERRYSYYYARGSSSSTSGGGSASTGGGSGTGGTGRIKETATWPARMAMREPRQARTPAGVPSFLASRAGLTGAWIISMGLVVLDEWKRNNIMPRPSRLWATSFFYLILAVMSMWDPVVPIVNLLAFGYVIMLAYQYFNQQGQFA